MKLGGIHQTSLALILSGGLAFATSQPSNAATMYSATELDTSGMTNVNVTGINNLGQVVGNVRSGSRQSGWENRAFRTAPNSPINLATDFIDVSPETDVFAEDINDLGQVSGYFSTSPQTSNFVAFRTAANSQFNQDTDIIYGNGLSIGQAINNSGQVAVVQLLPRIGVRSFRTNPNSSVNEATDYLGNLQGSLDVDSVFNDRTSTFVQDINQLGQVVGYSDNASGQYRAFRTAPNSAINPATDDLGTLGGFESRATAINNLGQVVGSSTTADGQTRAFRTAPNSAINPLTDDLGTLGGRESIATDINDSGQVVGYITPANNRERAFLYDNGQMFDLNSLIDPNLGVTLNFAWGINNRGQIIAEALVLDDSASSFRTRAFLLTPIATAAVPEPSFGLGLLAFAGMGGSLIGKRKQL
ncbi:MAG TPA: DUF3466 family protein [Leptolyngbyaceae cyanobacterium]